MPVWRGSDHWPDEKKQIWETQRNAMRKVERLFEIVPPEELDVSTFKPWFVRVADIPEKTTYVTLGSFAILKTQFLEHAEPQGTRRMTSGESHAVRDTVFDHGIVLPVLVEPDGTVIDGYHRILNELLSTCDGLPGREIPHIFVRFSSEEDRAKAIRILNTARRHESTRERLRELETMLLEGDNRTDAWIGSDLAIDPKTVTRVRESMERSGSLRRFETRRDPTGRRYKVRPLPPAVGAGSRVTRQYSAVDELVAPVTDSEMVEVMRLTSPNSETAKLLIALAQISPTWFRQFGISPVTTNQLACLLRESQLPELALSQQLQLLSALFPENGQLKLGRFRIGRTEVDGEGIFVYQLRPVAWSIYGPLVVQTRDAREVESPRISIESAPTRFGE